MHCRALSSFHRMALKLKKTALTGRQAGGRVKRDCPLLEHGAVRTSTGNHSKLWVVLEMRMLPKWQGICLKLDISSP